MSVGIACEQVTDAHIAGSLRARADEALYVAKRLGRDRVVMWAPGIRSNATPPWTEFVGARSEPQSTRATSPCRLHAIAGRRSDESRSDRRTARRVAFGHLAGDVQVRSRGAP